MTADTIVALSTPPGVAALAVIRLSGPESRAIIDRLVASETDGQPGRAVYRTLIHRNQTLDDVLLIFCPPGPEPRTNRSSTSADLAPMALSRTSI